MEALLAPLRSSGMLSSVRFTAYGLATESLSGWEPKKLFVRGADGGFEDSAFAEGFDSRADGRSLVADDLDGDGDLDLLMLNRAAPKLQLFENVGTGGGSVELALRATRGHPEADGAVVQVAGVGAFPVLLARGYASAVSPRVHVGLGTRPTAEVVVQWRSGAREAFGAVPAGGRYLLTEGTGAAALQQRFTARAPLPPSPWPATLEAVAPGQKGPALVQLFMESCAPCRREVPALNALHRRGLPVRGLGLHPPAALGAVRKRLGMEYPVAAMPEAVAAAFEGSNGLALPTVLVYGADGALLRVVAGEEHLPKVLAELGLARR